MKQFVQHLYRDIPSFRPTKLLHNSEHRPTLPRSRYKNKVGEAVYGQGKVSQTKVGRTIDGRTKDVDLNEIWTFLKYFLNFKISDLHHQGVHIHTENNSCHIIKDQKCLFGCSTLKCENNKNTINVSDSKMSVLMTIYENKIWEINTLTVSDSKTMFFK